MSWPLDLRAETRQVCSQRWLPVSLVEEHLGTADPVLQLLELVSRRLRSQLPAIGDCVSEHEIPLGVSGLGVHDIIKSVARGHLASQ